MNTEVLKVGDLVLRIDRNGEKGRTGTVTKVGRRWASVRFSEWETVQVDARTREYNGDSYGVRYMTTDEYAASQARAETRRLCNELANRSGKLTAEQATLLNQIMRETLDILPTG